MPKPAIEVPWAPTPPGGDKGEQARRVGIGLARVRTAAGLSERDLARLSGVGEGSIKAWERGKGLPSANSLAHVLFALGGALSIDSPGDGTESRELDLPAPVDPYAGCATVDEALGRWLDLCLPDRRSKYREPLLHRLGWNVAGAVTLQEAGELLGVTRERIRQIERDALAALAVCAPPSEILDTVADVIWESAPIFVDDVPELLAGKGLLGGEIDVLALLGAMARAGIQDVPAVFGDVIAGSEEEARTRVDYWARVEHALSSGRPLHVIDLVDVSDDPSTTVSSTRERLVQVDWVEWLDDDWLVDRRRLDGLRRLNPLTNTVDKLVRACGPLTVENVLAGLAISARRRVRGLVVPPEIVLRRFLELHGCFEIDDRGRVDWAPGFEGRPLAEGERILVELLRQRPDWRWADLREALVEAGLSEGFLAVAGQFSPHMMRLDHDRWCLRNDEQDEVRGRGLVRMDESFGARLRTARLAIGISQRELGERVGVAQPGVSRWELGDEQTPQRMLPLLEEAVGSSLLADGNEPA